MTKSICLVEAGEYLLGIDSTVIIGESDVTSLVKGERMDDLDIIFLDAFFQQVPWNKGLSDIRVVELRTAAGPFCVAVDTIRDELIESTDFEALPLLYPQLARSCCPQIMMHGREPVMILDIDALVISQKELGTDCGLISLGGLRQHKQAYVLETAAADASGAGALDLKKQPSTLSHAQFSEIVAWAMGQYLDGSNVSSIQVQGVERELSKRLVTRVVQTCGSFEHTAMERLKKQVFEGRP